MSSHSNGPSGMDRAVTLRKPSKRQQWYALALILGSNMTLIGIGQIRFVSLRSLLMAVGTCLLGVVGGSIWLLTSNWRIRMASRGRE